ncbi:TetR/AcrR family transcriptional regulator [Solirubrobacter sp. CPCC 204708]|uniref:TetR/AcrR family transcriptional regulator n=1 Tax=Solirubrobacter deserti TaxID=2282478 RepID=A0ABT4RJJ9_9ACTN|nr:TetR/AcrR family transcriptional regulator [Solirubrobacter deserti]MBE2319784.1 TetR/AcrR family transcriptional regulator [Solirubrobacter deserti]MDA0138732.1 TetR/AcrR family transcriptional regulator [Solirubrobacter deserti]
MPESTGGSDFRISLKLLWGTKERAPRGPKPTLTVDRVVETAIALADAEGIEQVSMRRVAERLGVGAMSLYRYVPSKAELLDLMLDRIHAEHADATPPADTEPWRARLTWHAHQSRALIQRHPWMLQVRMGQRPPLGPNIMAVFNAILGAAKDIGLEPHETLAVTELIDNYVRGSTRAAVEAVQVTEESGVSDEEWWGERNAFWEEYFEVERFPHITLMWEQGAYEEPVDQFEFGLQRVLDGIEAMLAGR